jgi:acetyl-CoA C-acetyltransferase
MPSIVICEPVRTPVGAFRGVFSGLTAAELATSVLTSLLARTGLGAENVDDLVLGHCYPSGESPAVPNR